MAQKIDICSPIFDMSVETVWKLFGMTDWDVSSIYNDMFLSGIPIQKQRTASLLNQLAVLNLADIKSIEPTLYEKIYNRFNNIEFCSNFAKNYMTNIHKPKDRKWSGIEHIKYSCDSDNISDMYERELIKYKTILDKNNITYNRNNNVFYFKVNNINCKIFPFDYIPDDNNIGIVHTTWKDYCISLIQTSDERVSNSYKEKLICGMLSQKYTERSVNQSTIDALSCLKNIGKDDSIRIFDDFWKDEYYIDRARIKSGKYLLSTYHLPQQTLEYELIEYINYSIENSEWWRLTDNTDLLFLLRLFEEVKIDYIKLNDDYLNDFYNKNSGNQIRISDDVKIDSISDTINDFRIKDIDNHDIYYEEKLSIIDIYNGNCSKDYIDKWSKRIIKSISKYLVEDIKSYYTYKSFVTGILRNDVDLKCMGFSKTNQDKINDLIKLNS